MLYREESIRKKHESVTQIPEGFSSPEETVARGEARRQLIQAVLRLDEPYRTAILLRYYDDLPPREIAMQQSIPIETVKTRLKEGLKRLRRKLDAAHDGDRRKWYLALVPLAGMNLTSSASASTGSTATVMGFIAMSAKIKIGIATAIIIGTAITIWQFLPEKDVVHSDSNLAQGGIDTEKVTVPIKNGVESRHLMPEEESHSRTILEPTAIVLSGCVNDSESGKPVTAFEIELLGKTENRGWTAPIRKMVRDREGRFLLTLEKSGDYSLSVNSSCYTRKILTHLKVPDDTGLTDLEIRLDPGLVVTGRVVDDATGQPVKGAVVASIFYHRSVNWLRLMLLDHEEAMPTAKTDENGWFTLKGLDVRNNLIAAVHPDYSAGLAATTPGSGEEVEVRLKSGFHIFGRAFDDKGNPASGILLTMRGDDMPWIRPVLTGIDGRYQTPPTCPGRVHLEAKNPPVEFGESLPFEREQKSALVVDRDLEVNFGPFEGQVIWQGTFYGYDGTPQASGRIQYNSLGLAIENDQDLTIQGAVRCDEQGLFAIRKLLPGSYNVTVYPVKDDKVDLFEGIKWEKVTFESPGYVVEDIVLNREALISGVVVDSITGSILVGKNGFVSLSQNKPNAKYYHSQIDQSGCFRLESVHPGTYCIDALVYGRPLSRQFGFKIEKGEQKTDVRLVVESGGQLLLRGSGFSKSNDCLFNLINTTPGEEKSHNMLPPRFKEDGSFERNFDLKCGSYCLLMSFPAYGCFDREFEILPNQITEIIVNRDDLFPHEGSVTLTGKLFRSDGSPISGRELVFLPWNVYGLPSHKPFYTAVTDEEGRFIIEGFKQGFWYIKSENKVGGNNTIYVFLVPRSANSPYHCNFCLGTGSITGNLFDDQSGLPFESGKPESWVVALHDVDKDVYPCEYYVSEGRKKGNPPNSFYLEDLSSGRYELLIRSDWYFEHHTDVFALSDGESLDFGKIGLTPCGTLLLKVHDENGQPVPSFEVYLEGEIKVDRYYGTRKNEWIYENLPPGKMVIKIVAIGFLEYIEEIELEAAKPLELSVVLKSK
jgi:protocatechuate 3,4-dioxygenase beta subunit